MENCGRFVKSAVHSELWTAKRVKFSHDQGVSVWTKQFQPVEIRSAPCDRNRSLFYEG